ncbi:MAG: glycosyltransferase [Saprospiraceae bacterium]|nr:glycosyltransferase [Saprospiraceae bacterium]
MSGLSALAQQIIFNGIKPEDIVVVAPLNWGLGHAARCVPIITFLKSYCQQIYIASDGEALELLKKEFPDLDFIKLPSYNIRYKYNSMFLNMLIQSPAIARTYLREKKAARKIVSHTGASVIISDNRFGFRCDGIRNYYITHQINILHPVPLFSMISTKLHHWIIEKYHECWIPDYIGEKSISGLLSQNKNLMNTHYLGPITRIKILDIAKKGDLAVLLTGPEPQRSNLESLLLPYLEQLKQFQIVLIRGAAKNKITKTSSHIRVLELVGTTEMEEILNSCQLLISRSGYTTLMDIEKLKIKAVFIPTPGQPEQEYLAENASVQDRYVMVKQDNLSTLIAQINSLISI